MSNIYSSVPDDVLSGDSGNKQKLRSFLKGNSGQFFTARKLAKECGYPVGNTQVSLRLAITELIEVDMCPIVGNSKGFAWIVHPNMLLFYIENLEQRRLGLQRKIEAVRKIYERETAGQDKA